MFFELDKAEQGDWFQFFDSHFDTTTGEIVYEEPEEGAAEFCIRSLRPFWEERLKKRTKESKMVLNPSTRAMERVSFYPDLTPEESMKEADDAWDYGITGIKKALDADGKEIECTRENKLKFLKIPKFLRFIQRVFQILDGEAEKKKEAAEKN